MTTDGTTDPRTVRRIRAMLAYENSWSSIGASRARDAVNTATTVTSEEFEAARMTARLSSAQLEAALTRLGFEMTDRTMTTDAAEVPQEVHALKVGTDTVCGSAGVLVSVSPKLDGVTCSDCRRIRALPIEKVTVQLFKPNGKWYCEDDWRIPTEVKDHSEHRGDFVREAIGPFDMRQSPDFRQISGGPALIEAQEPWGYACLLT